MQDIVGTSYEMGSLGEPSLPQTPATLSAQLSMTAPRAIEPQEGMSVHELPPVDRGVGAWTFCIFAVIVGIMD